MNSFFSFHELCEWLAPFMKWLKKKKSISWNGQFQPIYVYNVQCRTRPYVDRLYSINAELVKRKSSVSIVYVHHYARGKPMYTRIFFTTRLIIRHGTFVNENTNKKKIHFDSISVCLPIKYKKNGTHHSYYSRYTKYLYVSTSDVYISR